MSFYTYTNNLQIGDVIDSEFFDTQLNAIEAGFELVDDQLNDPGGALAVAVAAAAASASTATTKASEASGYRDTASTHASSAAASATSAATSASNASTSASAAAASAASLATITNPSSTTHLAVGQAAVYTASDASNIVTNLQTYLYEVYEVDVLNFSTTSNDISAALILYPNTTTYSVLYEVNYWEASSVGFDSVAGTAATEINNWSANAATGLDLGCRINRGVGRAVISIGSYGYSGIENAFSGSYHANTGKLGGVHGLGRMSGILGSSNPNLGVILLDPTWTLTFSAFVRITRIK